MCLFLQFTSEKLLFFPDFWVKKLPCLAGKIFKKNFVKKRSRNGQKISITRGEHKTLKPKPWSKTAVLQKTPILKKKSASKTPIFGSKKLCQIVDFLDFNLSFNELNKFLQKSQFRKICKFDPKN